MEQKLVFLDIDGTLTVPGALLNLVLFLLFYFITLGATALGRRIFCPEKKEFRSILD